MGNRDHLKLGSWAVICDRCGFKFRGEELITEWNNLKVCRTCHEPRNQQDFLTGVPDVKPMPYTRPVTTEVFIDTSVPVNPYSLKP